MITGCGVVSPLGRGAAAFFDGLLAGRSAIAPIRRFAADDLTPHMAAEVVGEEFARDAGARAAAFALAATNDALAAAGLASGAIDPARLGIALGTTLGGMDLFEAWEADRRVATTAVESIPYFGPAVTLARQLGARGPVATPQLACASGTYAVAVAARWIERGEADVVVAGGTDLLCRFVVAGFNALKATTDLPRPFDQARRGLALGEGAAVVILESAAHAEARSVAAPVRILGCGAAADAVHMTAPDREGRGAAEAMRAALAAAAIEPGAVDFVSAHGTGTVYNDAMEARAITAVFGRRGVAVNSIKGAIGHTLGAAGAFEAVLCAEAIRRGVIPPTAGLESIDPACADLDVVSGAARPTPVRIALSTSSGFAGANAAIVLGAV